MSAEVILFWSFAVLAVASAVVVVTARNPINSAMALVASFFFLAGVYVLLWAHTIAVLQILVYAGAIMVLFLFVIMLLSLAETGLRRSSPTVMRITGGLAAGGLLVALLLSISGARLDPVTMSAERVASFGTLVRMGEVLYTQYLLPFQAVALLLLVATVGSVVVAKSRI